MFLDTSFCIDLMRERSRGQRGPAVRKLEACATLQLYASVFVICELEAGARMASQPQREIARVQRFAELVGVEYPGPTFAVAYGETEARLRKDGTPIPTMDLLIGVLALTHGAPLITRDVGHFARIHGLTVETY